MRLVEFFQLRPIEDLVEGIPAIKRRDAEAHLNAHGVFFLRAGASSHDTWIHKETGIQGPMLTHHEVQGPTFLNITKRFGVCRYNRCQPDCSASKKLKK